MSCLAFCLNLDMDISEIWGAHLRAIIDRIAPGEGRGVKTPAYREVAEKTRFEKEYVYQAYTGRKRIGQDFAKALERAFGEGMPAGWINVAPQQSAGAPGEPVQLDHSPTKREGPGLNEFLNYLNTRYPQAPLTPEEVIEEAEAYREYLTQRLARRLLKREFQAPDPVADARVEAAFAEAQRRERQASIGPEQQLIENPLKGREKKMPHKKARTS